ncbi:4-(cytidine 5'-diphospho)-2-C-methyl-D-erythritol kinase [Magnetococcales bacterium HHB-1]
MTLPTQITLTAPAKINLTLHIVGREQTGYHQLRSVMVFFPLFDALHFDLNSRTIQVNTTPALDIPLEDHLVYRAAKALQQHGRTDQGVKINLYKRIPQAAGLGGGSSDAATTLLALNRLWQLNLPTQALCTLGVQLGADIPFFIKGHAAFVEGIGERLTPLERIPSYPVLLINPNQHLSTKAVFHAYRDSKIPFNKENYTPTQKPYDQIDTWVHGNDLEASAIEMKPIIADMITALWQQNAETVQMSGSGPTVFAVFKDKKRLWQAKNNIEKSHPRWQVIAGESMKKSSLYTDIKPLTE